MKYSLLFIFSFIFTTGFGQMPFYNTGNGLQNPLQDNTNLINTNSGPNYHWRSGDRIELNPGTVYAPAPGNSAIFEIDKNIPIPVSYGSNSSDGFDESLIVNDISLAFGATKGYEDITSNGNATYTIPIEIPKGSAGFEPPPMGLQYISGSGNGLLGMGWDLIGLYGISRQGRNLHDDSYVSAISLTNKDRFVYNGSILMCSADDYNGLNNTTYHTKEESFSVITSYNSSSAEGRANPGPDYFTVLTKDGLIIEIGNTPDSKLTENRTVNVNSDWIIVTSVVKWMVNKITDKNGNYVLFEYDTKENTEIVLKKIRYTGNTSMNISADNEINFYYNISNFPNKIAVGQKLVNSTLLLREIECNTNNGQLYKRYKMSYNNKNVWEFLVSVQEFNMNNEPLNKSNFVYDNQFTENSIQYLNIKESNGSISHLDLSSEEKLVFLDCNGDGYKDFVKYSGIGYFNQSGTKKSFYKNNKDGTYSKYWQLNSSFPSSFSLTGVISNFLSTGSINDDIGRFNDFDIIDFNGDGLEDFVIISKQKTFEGHLRALLEVFISNGNGYDELKPNGIDVLIKDGIDNTVLDDHQFIFSDFDLDGKDDILLMRKVDTGPIFIVFKLVTNVMSLSNTSFNSAASNPMGLLGNFESYSNSFAIDKYSIGYPTIVGLHRTVIDENTGAQLSNSPLSGKCILHYQRTTNTFLAFKEDLPIVTIQDCENTSNGKGYIGDFNGDGYIDNLVSQPDGSDWRVRTTITNGYSENTISSLGNPANCENKFLLGDVNADGKTDVVGLVNSQTNNTLTATVYYSKGDNFSLGQLYDLGGSLGALYDADIQDMNGDGINDLVVIPRNSSGSALIYYFEKAIPNCLLKKVVDGAGRETKFSYKVSTENSVYTIANRLTYPFFTDYFPHPLVSSIENSDGVGSFFKSSYTYEDASINLEGIGAIGFKKNTVLNEDLNVKTIFERTLAQTHAVYIDWKTDDYKLPNNLHLSKIVEYNTAFDVFSQGNISSYFIKQNNVTKTDYLSGAITSSINSIDNNGNITLNITNYDDILTEEITTHIDDTHFFTVPYLPEYTINKTVKNGQYNQNKTTYSYNSNKLLVTKTDNALYTAKSVVNNYEYFTNGNLKKTTIHAAGVPDDIVTQFDYDAAHKNIAITTNTANQATNYLYHPILNLPTQITEANGLITQNKYDGWGRKKETIMPNGISRFYNYTRYSTGSLSQGQHPLQNIDKIEYSISETEAGKPTTTNFYDILQRNLLTETDGFDEKVYAAQQFNDKGDEENTTNTYSLENSSYAPVITNYLRVDPLNRITKSDAFDGSSHLITNIEYTYSSHQLTTKQTAPDGKETKYVTDQSGALISTIDNNMQSIVYDLSFNSSNNHSYFTTTIGTQMTKTEFDEIGQQLILTDAFAGVYNYTYNPIGQLTQITTPLSHVYTMQYNNLGQIRQKDGPEGAYIYTYESAANGLNQLKELRGPGNIKYNYTYNNMQLQTQIKEDHNGTIYTTDYEYDLLGNNTKIIYPENGTPTRFAVKQNYNSKGYLTSINQVSNNNSIWIANEVNPIGQYTKYRLGTGNPQTTVAYNNFGVLQSKKTPGILDVNYTISNQNGNLGTRTNNLKNYEETFTYDPLDRLKTIQNNLTNSDVQTIDYNNLGQITTKPDAGGTYNYQNNRLQYIQDPNTGAISLQTQDIAFNAFNMAQNISENNIELAITYGPDQQRIKGEWKQNGVIYRTRKYATNYEETTEGTNTFNVHYINAPTGLAAMYVIENGVGNMYYTYTDNLESINVVTNNAGTIVAEQSFDAWGRRVDVNTLQPLTAEPSIPAWLYRGYTGHEMLNEFRLINMNARLYDAVVGQFLSPDNFLQDPLNSQNYARYNYVLNNPLKFNDPTGNSNSDPSNPQNYIWDGYYLNYSGSPGDLSSVSSLVSSNKHQVINKTNDDIIGSYETHAMAEYISQSMNKQLSTSVYSYRLGGVPGSYNSSNSGSNSYMADQVMGDNNTYLGPQINNFGGINGLTVNTFYGGTQKNKGQIVIRLNYTGKKAKGGNWSQIIDTDDPAEFKKSPYYDSNNGSKYYYNSQEIKNMTNGNSITFYDAPYRYGNANWKAYLTLYSANNEKLFILSYGFNLKNSKITIIPLTVIYNGLRK